ncbi:HIT domain-containing protein [Candidatus Pacearchaeota archaeon]|nr:HIT domain-containing protein [Candidatus Pacearchaeota archaeon]
MSLTPQQVKELKAQLLQQVQHLPHDQKREFIQKIEDMAPETLELMLEQQQGKQKPIFRMIIDKEVPSTIIDENSHAMAVLEINPVSEAHTLIIPKKPASAPKEIPPEAFELAKRVARTIEERLRPKSVDLVTETKFGESIINIIPSYNVHVTLASPRKKSSPADLGKVAQKLKPEEKKEVIKIQKQPAKKDPIVKLPRRIP